MSFNTACYAMLVLILSLFLEASNSFKSLTGKDYEGREHIFTIGFLLERDGDAHLRITIE